MKEIKGFDLFSHLDSRTYVYLAVSALFIAMIVVSPMLNSGYTNDDSMNSLIKGKLEMGGQDVSNYFSNFVLLVFNKLGRFYPLAAISPLASSYIGLSLSKALVFAFIAIDLVLFAYFVKIFTKSTGLAILSLLLVPLSIQYRLYHDPVLGYTLLLQIIVFLLLSSFILLTCYMENGNKAYLASSIVIYLISLMFGEVTYPFIMVHLVIIYFKSKNKVPWKMLSAFAPYLLLTCIVISIPVAFRLAIGIPLVGQDSSNQYVVSPDIISFAEMMIRQTASAIPLSYYAIDPNGIFSNAISDIINNFSYMIILVAIGYFMSTMILVRRSQAEIEENTIDRRDMDSFCLLGFLLLILPGALISLLPKYQSEVIWGFGYIYGYISCFGAASILIFILYKLLNTLKSMNKKWYYPAFTVIAISLMLVSVLSYTSNAIATEKSDQYWQYPRGLVEESMNDGLFSGVADGSVLLVDSNYPWDQPSFYYLNSGVRLDGLVINGKIRYANTLGSNFSELYGNEIISQSSDKSLFICNRSPYVYYLRYYADSKDDGYAILAKADYVSASGESFYGVSAKDFYLYVRCPTPHPADYFQQDGYATVTEVRLDDNLKPDGAMVINEDNMTLVAYGNGWKLLKISNDRQIDAQSLSVSIGSHYTEPSQF